MCCRSLAEDKCCEIVKFDDKLIAVNAQFL